MKRLGHSLQAGFPAFERNEARGWDRSILFRGATENLDWIGTHVSRLQPDAPAHGIERHADEELILLLRGEATVSLCDDKNTQEVTRKIRLKPGQLLFHPAFQFHNIEGTGNKPALYLNFKWRSPSRNSSQEPANTTSIIFDLPPIAQADETSSRTIVGKTKTLWLNTLSIHQSVLEPGDGYRAHADRHDVGIIVLDGQVTCNACIYGPGSCLFHPAGWKHGLRNTSNQPATYLVYEFHGMPSKLKLAHIPELIRHTVARSCSNLAMRA